uniref:Ribosomal protein S10 n=1 Tax=Lithodesmium undulatum TaxID=59812 RepID=A0A7T6UZP1_LITUN|nr:ribosomal protein S10 [Lithodesmium undulatum]QQJ94643.1 ribosomal protein S10 [Lithodesmium undulatum]
MFVNINISSKHLDTVNDFVIFFFKLVNLKNLKLKIFKKFKNTSKKKKTFTVLKSPHVNKTAQEQFKSEIFSYNIYFYSLQLPKILFILKKINTSLFQDLNLKIRININEKNKIKIKCIKLDSDNYFLLKANSSRFVIEKYIKIISYFGEKKVRHRFL